MSDAKVDRFLPDLCSARAVLVVVVVAELMALVITLVSAYYLPFELSRFAIISLFVQWVALTSATLVCYGRPWLDRLPPSWAAVAVVAVVVADTMLFSVIAHVVGEWFLLQANPAAMQWSRLVLINGLVAAIISGLVMRYFYVQEQLRVKGQAELEMRIQALQSRIRPHFLFNSMNIIASLIAVDPDAAEQVVEDLSVLFRASLQSSQSQVPLSEELSLCQRYMHIEQLRMGDRLQVQWHIDVDQELIKIPPLTLQPLLENAIYHGIQPLGKGGVVVISAQIMSGNVVIRVTNPKPEGEGHHKGNQVALENIRHRLEALHGSAAAIQARPSAEQYEIEIRYPLQQQGN